MIATPLPASAALAGSGVAIIQALVPGVVKRWFPRRVPAAMGLYSASLMAVASAHLVVPANSDGSVHVVGRNIKKKYQSKSLCRINMN
ncbi:hypothetical protein CAY91_34960 [Pseudomonas aeruginosa]|nr:hypothetical protein CAY91_34960 [Pseudomonas aeruginosa]